MRSADLFSFVKQFYVSLLSAGLQVNTLDNIHTVLQPTFQLAVRDNVLRSNPSDGVMVELKKNDGKNKGIRHALTACANEAKHVTETEHLGTSRGGCLFVSLDFNVPFNVPTDMAY
jgi:hypothetical protein